MTLRSRIVLPALFGAVLLPAVAHAQEPQPWTNLSYYGDRVVPALPVRTVEQVVARGDLGTGSTRSFKLTDDRTAEIGGGPTSKASFLSGRSGMSYGWESFDLFVTSYAYQVSIPKLRKSTTVGPLSTDPSIQSGDATLGARWTMPVASGLHAGVEGGATFLGRTADPGNEGIPFSGPNMSATSPFARGLFTFQGLGRSNNEEPPLTVSLNLGVFADRSWLVWEEALKNSAQPESNVDDPLEEERITMSFYGDKGPVTRLLFGASVGYRVASIARPYFEITGEKTGPDTTMRVTPGVAITPLPGQPLAIFVSADVDLSGDPEVSPHAPAVRANVGLQFALGERRTSARPIRTPGPTPTPPPKRGFMIGVTVVDERGQPINAAKVRVYSTTPVDGSLPVIGEKDTDASGTCTVVTPLGTSNALNVLVSAKHPDYMEWNAVSFPPKSGSPKITLYKQKTRITLLYIERGQPWQPPPGVEVSFAPTTPKLRAPKSFTNLSNIDLPANEEFRDWQIAVSIPDFALKATGNVKDFPPPLSTLRIYVDSEKKCAELTPTDKCIGVTPIPTTTPAVPMDRFSFNVFEGDSVEMKTEEAQRLFVKLLPAQTRSKSQVTVQAKKGDALFQQALAQARRDALLAWLNGKGIEAGTVHIVVNYEAASDAVLLEIPR